MTTSLSPGTDQTCLGLSNDIGADPPLARPDNAPPSARHRPYPGFIPNLEGFDERHWVLKGTHRLIFLGFEAVNDDQAAVIPQNRDGPADLIGDFQELRGLLS